MLELSVVLFCFLLFEFTKSIKLFQWPEKFEPHTVTMEMDEKDEEYKNVTWYDYAMFP